MSGQFSEVLCRHSAGRTGPWRQGTRDLLVCGAAGAAENWLSVGLEATRVRGGWQFSSLALKVVTTRRALHGCIVVRLANGRCTGRGWLATLSEPRGYVRVLAVRIGFFEIKRQEFGVLSQSCAYEKFRSRAWLDPWRGGPPPLTHDLTCVR
jgi:hypothetical protein